MGGATTKYGPREAGALRSEGDGIRTAAVSARPKACKCPSQVLAWACSLAVLLTSSRLTAGAVDNDPAAVARKAFQAAEMAYQASPNGGSNAWEFARACFDLAEFATKNAERAELAQQGIKAAQQAIARDNKSAPAHYYLGMDLGQLARTKSLGALRLVNQMEREFKQAHELNEHFDYAGPDRNLGLLYRDAPTLTSVGSRSKARQHLLRAVELAPDFPENRLSLMEAYMKWGERAEAQKQLRALEGLWAGAQKAFTGETWASSWTDWEQRLKQAQTKLEEPSKATESSKQKQRSEAPNSGPRTT